MSAGAIGRMLVVVAVGVLLVPPSLAWAKKKPKPRACAGGVFAFAAADAAALEEAIGRPASAVVLTGTELRLADCAGTNRIKAKRKATAFKARLSACGPLTRVKIRGTIAAPGCSELRATLKARRAKRLRLTATRGLPPTTRELIARALAEGRIDYPTSLAYRTWAFFLDPQLPPEFDAPGLGAEDTSLFAEIRDAWAGLPPAVQASLAPYIVRPDDPTSAFGPGPAAIGRTDAVAQALEERQCPNYWTHLDAAVANVRVWDCSSGDPATDAAFLGKVTAIFDKHWPIMTGDMGPPVPDDGVGNSPAIDVYLISTGTCMRRGICRGLEASRPGAPDPIAVAVQAPPYTAVGSGGERSSGFILLRRERAASADLDFESDVIHEFFHVLQFAHTTKSARRVGEDWVQSFFTEASATWSEWMYLPSHSAVTHGWWSAAFIAEPGSLLLTNGRHEYASYIWPFFVQQENRAPERIFAAWRAAEGATGPEDVDAAVDQQLSFVTNFRRFALRNLNWKPPGNPLETLFGELDSRFPLEEHPAVAQLDGIIGRGIERAPTALEIPSLMAHYERFEVQDDVQHIVFDFEVEPASDLDVDALVKVDDTWKRIRSEGNRRLEFCRDDPEERVDEIVLVLSNHERTRDADGQPGKLAGTYYLTTNTSCAAWSGTITYVETLVETSDETTFPYREVFTRDRLRKQTWTIQSTGPIDFYGQMLDGATLGWNGSLNQTDFQSETRLDGPCLQGAVISTTSTDQGQGSGQRDVAITAAPGFLNITPISVDPLQFDVEITQVVTYCPDTTATFTSTQQDNDSPIVIFAARPLTPSPGDPDLFEGTWTAFHDEQPRPGGSSVLDGTYTWSIRRRVTR